MAKIRVLVVEDSLTVRRRLCEVLESDAELEIVGEASDGKRAIELCRDRRPDVVTMDMMLPGMTGLGATEYIMAHCPTPILIVSSSTNRGEAFQTFDALAAGAVDVLDKPRGDEADGTWERQFLKTVKLVSRIRVITHPRARLGALGRARSELSESRPPAPAMSARGRIEVVALGASTGGPAALAAVLKALPKDVTVPILIVLHVSELFAAPLAEWLDGQAGRRVRYVTDGETLSGATAQVILAPPGRHLTLRGGLLVLTSDPERHSCRPSVDVLFESVAVECGSSAAACLLTGMGRDGATGLLAVRRAGGLTLTQDEASSVVYGMPREAALLGAAEHILPLDEIGPSLSALLRRSARVR